MVPIGGSARQDMSVCHCSAATATLVSSAWIFTMAGWPGVPCLAMYSSPKTSTWS